jgi:hypothetical protein
MDIGIHLSEKSDDKKNIEEMLDKIRGVVRDYDFALLQWGDWNNFLKACAEEYAIIKRYR